MAFDADKFGANIAETHKGGKFRISNKDGTCVTIRHDDWNNIHFLTIQSTAAIIFDDWQMNEAGDALRFTRRYIGYDGDMYRMTTGTLSIMKPEEWTVGDVEADQ